MSATNRIRIAAATSENGVRILDSPALFGVYRIRKMVERGTRQHGPEHFLNPRNARWPGRGGAPHLVLRHGAVVANRPSRDRGRDLAAAAVVPAPHVVDDEGALWWSKGLPAA